MKNWSLNKKIWSIIGLLSGAFLICSGISIYEAVKSRDILREVTGVYVKRDQITSEVKDSQRVLVSSLLEVVLRTEPAEIRTYQKMFDDSVANLRKNAEDYRAIASDEGKALLDKYMLLANKYIAIAEKTRVLADENKNDEAMKVLATGDDIREEMRGLLGDINKVTAARLSAIIAQAEADATRGIILNSVMSVISIITALLISFFVLKALAAAIAAVVASLSDSAAQVSSASSQIASASEELSQATTEQAASLEETAASVEELNSMVAKNSENANSAATTTSRSQQMVDQGKRVVERMIGSMESINKSAEGMAEVVRVIEQIDKKTKVINEIVNKTELLSFNASVEAARAGEHGKGFAVVAEEVGNLARMSGSAAEEIATLLESSLSAVNSMVAETKKNVDTGSQVTRECGEVFDGVVTDVSTVSGMATEIASASEEQSRGCAEITKAMAQLDQMTQQNAATSEECASAAEELSAQAETLKNVVQQLVFTVNGREQGASATFTAPLPVATTKKPATSRNVVPLKTAAPKASSYKGDGVEPKFKAAAGSDVPDYDSSGFTDV